MQLVSFQKNCKSPRSSKLEIVSFSFHAGGRNLKQPTAADAAAARSSIRRQRSSAGAGMLRPPDAGSPQLRSRKLQHRPSYPPAAGVGLRPRSAAGAGVCLRRSARRRPWQPLAAGRCRLQAAAAAGGRRPAAAVGGGRSETGSSPLP